MKTLIIGASINPERYAYKAAQRLLENGYGIYLLGNRAGEVFAHEIFTEQRHLDDVDTVTLYVSAKNQLSYYDYIISLKPRRVIFNPGTENPELMKRLDEVGIEYELACTLVLLATKTY